MRRMTRYLLACCVAGSLAFTNAPDGRAQTGASGAQRAPHVTGAAPGEQTLSQTRRAISLAGLGFRDDGTDNAALIPALNSAMGTITGGYGLGAPVVFAPNLARDASVYYFTQPLSITREGSITCNDGSRVGNHPARVALAFAPGVSGVRFENRGTANDGGGVDTATLNGCLVLSLGLSTGTHGRPTTAGNKDIAYPNFALPFYILWGNRTSLATPNVAIGDSLVMYPLNVQSWKFAGSVTGNVLTVTSKPTAFTTTTDPGIAVGQMLLATSPTAGMPNGIFIVGSQLQGSMCGGATCTGTGGTGTYLLNASIASPPVASQARTGVLAFNCGPICFETENQSGAPMVAPGSVVTNCSSVKNDECVFSAAATLTLSNPPRLGQDFVTWLLPGPKNTSYPSQMYNVTTSQTGQTYSTPITAGISNGGGGAGTILNVTSCAGCSLNLGQKIIGTHGGSVSKTTTGALTLGQYTNIPIASCTGITGGMYVIGWANGNAVFPPGTRVASCSGNQLSVAPSTLTGQPIHASYVTTTSGSKVVSIFDYYLPPWVLWVGEPITGTTGIQANTTVQSWSLTPGDSTRINITMSNVATATGYTELAVGGVIYAAPPETTLTFLSGAATITAFGNGDGGKGTYSLDTPALLAPGATLYAFDTPATLYVTGGPRPLKPQDLLWSDAMPFGAIAWKVYGVSPSKQTVIAANSYASAAASALATHRGGSGKLWVLPAGLTRSQQGNSYGNFIYGFPVGINMACMQSEYPETGCGRSRDSDNTIFYSLVGRYVVGNNSGGSASTFNEYDHNYVCDVCEFAGIGSLYIGEMLQGQDESSNTQVVTVANCSMNASSFISSYASGSEWEATCLPISVYMLGTTPTYSTSAPAWITPMYQYPYDATLIGGGGVTCSGPPSASFATKGGVVIHC